MTVNTRTVDYEHDGTALQGMLATPDTGNGKTGGSTRPAVMICHAWAGRSAFENAFAEKMAAWGYAGFAIDLYGKGVLGASREENQSLIEPFMTDRDFLKRRLLHALDCARAQDEIDPQEIVVAGFCFGGLCALDVARSGADVRGCASFHGLFARPPETTSPITAKVIAYHGYDDPMAEPEAMRGFCDEMTRAKADWQLRAFGGVMHAFTNPDAKDPDFGTVFVEQARDRSVADFKTFLDECFAGK